MLTQFEEQGVLVQNMLSEQQQFRRERLPSQRSPPQTPFSEGSSARHPSNDEFLDSANQSLQIRLRDTEEALRVLYYVDGFAYLRDSRSAIWIEAKA